jgi:uncharacterized protein
MSNSFANQKQVLFLQGGGEGGYEADALLADSLKANLGAEYNVHYPQMPDEDSPDFGWGKKIDQELAEMQGDIILVAHSLGGSILLKYLSEKTIDRPISGIFIISAPFWGGDKNWQYESLNLQTDFAEKLPKGVPVFLYQSKDDEEVDFSHLGMYAKKLPQATVYEKASGGHQFGNDLSQVALDIKGLK